MRSNIDLDKGGTLGEEKNNCVIRHEIYFGELSEQTLKMGWRFEGEKMKEREGWRMIVHGIFIIQLWKTQGTSLQVKN